MEDSIQLYVPTDLYRLNNLSHLSAKLLDGPENHLRRDSPAGIYAVSLIHKYLTDWAIPAPKL
jgi:hypothetical protein